MGAGEPGAEVQRPKSAKTEGTSGGPQVRPQGSKPLLSFSRPLRVNRSSVTNMIASVQIAPLSLEEKTKSERRPSHRPRRLPR